MFREFDLPLTINAKTIYKTIMFNEVFFGKNGVKATNQVLTFDGARVF